MLETGVYVVGKYYWWPLLLIVDGYIHVASQFCVICVCINSRVAKMAPFSPFTSNCCHAVNGFVMVVWIGQQVSGDLVAKLFGVTSQAQINMDMVSQGLNF